MKIEVRNLSKSYKDKQALQDLSFTLGEQKIYGLLGRNGAGKTTFMDILSGNLQPSEGEVLIDGRSPFSDQKLRQSICLIKDSENVRKELKVKNMLKLYSYFYPTWSQKLADEMIDEFGLDRNARIKTFSKGMESALGITLGLASRAPITVFDEPYIGLDAAARKRFYQLLLEEYETEKRTFIFSTHLIDEVSLLFEEVLILQQGRLILQEDSELLRSRASAVSGAADQVEAFIKNRKVWNKQQFGGVMTAYVNGSSEEAEQAGLTAKGIPIQDLMVYMTESREGVLK